MIKEILLYIWQLPQNIVGYIICLFYEVDKIVPYKDAKIRVCSEFPGGISLGKYVIVRYEPLTTRTINTVKHEYGHTRQSLYLGPLYLLVIGLPSLIWAAFYSYNPKKPNGYYRFYTEKWADKIENIVR